MSFLSRFLKLPRLRVTASEFSQLPEYSCSYPTGTTPGKMWRREDGSHDVAYLKSGGKPVWLIGEYDPNDDGKGQTIKVNWYLPVFRVPAGRAVW